MQSVPVSPVNVFKKRLSQIYNQISQDMYGTGVREQKIEIFFDKILVFGQHKRVPALAALRVQSRRLAVSVDAALLMEYKTRLKQQLEQTLALKVITVLQDYDPETELACTVIYLDKSMQ